MAIAPLLFLLPLALCLHSVYGHGIHTFKGPLLASLTDFWRFFYAYQGKLFPMRGLHDRYGSVVRVGPNALAFGDPQAVKDIFGAGKNWKKVNLSSGHVLRWLTCSCDQVKSLRCQRCRFQRKMGTYFVLLPRSNMAPERAKSHECLLHPNDSSHLRAAGRLYD